jgi:hypothetical protein
MTDTPNEPADLKLKISHDENFVRIDIGEKIWFLMPKPQALEFAFAVLTHCGVSVEQHDLTKGKPS